MSIFSTAVNYPLATGSSCHTSVQTDIHMPVDSELIQKHTLDERDVLYDAEPLLCVLLGFLGGCIEKLRGIFGFSSNPLS